MRNPLKIPFRVASAAFLVVLLSLPARAASPQDDPAVPAILARAESLFQSMKSRYYPAVFAALSVKSRETIVAETSSALAAAVTQAPPGKPYSADTPTALARDPAPGPEAVRRDFTAGRPIALRLLGRLPSPLRPGRRPGAQPLGDRLRGEGPGGDPPHPPWRRHPATLKMFREDGGWKAGLVETFWSAEPQNGDVPRATGPFRNRTGGSGDRT
jgi:hypothetical protein